MWHRIICRIHAIRLPPTNRPCLALPCLADGLRVQQVNYANSAPIRHNIYCDFALIIAANITAYSTVRLRIVLARLN